MMTPDSLKLIVANPFYCLRKVDETFIVEHEPLLDEDAFVTAGAALINEIGGAEYIRLVLKNLKGDFIRSGTEGR